MRTLRDRVAVVTGAGSGIGRGLALELAKQGSRLALQDVQEDRVQAVAAEARALGATVLVDAFDVSREDAMRAFAGRVADELGGAHLVVNNAGVSVSGDFVDVTLDDWRWIVGVNLWGVIHGCHFFLPQVLARDEGHVVNISSVFGLIGVPSQSAYCATKFAVRGLSESLHIELHGTNVGLTCVHPGAIATRIVVDSRHNFDHRRERRVRRMLDAGMKPERAAQHIVAAVLNGEPRLRVGRDAMWIDRMARILPVRYRMLVRRFSDRHRR